MANEVNFNLLLLLKDLKQMKFVFERKFFAERSKNLERSEKFSHEREQQNLFQLLSEAKNFLTSESNKIYFSCRAKRKILIFTFQLSTFKLWI